MHRISTVLIITALTLGLPLLAAAHDGDIDKVNGAVHIAGGAVVDKASTVNGSVELGDKAQASEVGTVNGSISLGNGSHVGGVVDAVNGSIHLAPGADVGGKLSNVNGAIVLDDAHVAGGIGTVNGDITVGADSHVEGGILVDKPGGWFNWHSHTPLVVIGPHAVVQGTLEFRREVVLKVSDSAQIGPVKGATVVKFSGAQP